MPMQNAADIYERDGDNQFIMVLRPDPVFGFSTRRFYCNAPECDIHEMAWSHSMQSRFTGHMRRRYSVAEHCLLVADLMQLPEVAERGGSEYEGLMHDAHEGYVSDLAAPWKVTVKDYRAFEGKIETAMRERFGLTPKISDGVKYADWLALFIEAETLIVPGATLGWYEPEPGTRDRAIQLVDCDARYMLDRFEEHSPREMYEAFMARFLRLAPPEE